MSINEVFSSGSVPSELCQNVPPWCRQVYRCSGNFKNPNREYQRVTRSFLHELFPVALSALTSPSYLVWSKWYHCFDICFNLKYSLLKFPTLPFNSSTWSWTGCGWHSRGCPGYCAEGCVKQRKQRNDGLFLSLEVL